MKQSAIKYQLLTLLLFLLAACRQAEVEYVDFDTFHPTSIKTSPILMDDGSINPEIQLFDDGNLFADSLTNSQADAPRRIASTTITDMVRDLLSSVNYNNVLQIAGTYTGHDIDGNPLTQSGKIILPKSGPIHNVIIVSHYTIGANYEAPSETFSMEGIFAGKGYAIVLADYIGYGVTKDRIHPYLHAESTARSVVDMALAAIPYLKHIGRAPESDEVILLGYSQGGATTLAVLNLIQSKFRKQLPIRRVFAGAGPYDLTATYDISMSEDKTGIPCAIPMIVQGISEGEHLNLDMHDFFMPRLLDNYSSWINSKQFTVREINNLIEARQLSLIMTPEGCNKKSKQTARLYKALMMNSVLNFKPQAPLYLFHSRNDDTVPFINSQRAEVAFKGLPVEYNFGNYGSHMNGFLKFMSAVSSELANSNN